MSAAFSDLMEGVQTALAIDSMILQQPVGQVKTTSLSRLIVFVCSHAVARRFVIDLDELDYCAQDFSEGGQANFLLKQNVIFVSRDSELLNLLKTQLDIKDIHDFSLETRIDDPPLAIDIDKDLSESSLEVEPDDLPSIGVPSIGLPDTTVSNTFVALKKIVVTGSIIAEALESDSGALTLDVESSDKIWLNCQLVVGSAPLSADLFAIINSTFSGTIEIPLGLEQVLPTLSGRVSLTLCIDMSQISGDVIGVGVVLKDVLTKLNITRISKALILKRIVDTSNSELSRSTFAARLEPSRET